MSPADRTEHLPGACPEVWILLMDLRRMGVPKAFTSLRERRSADSLGAVGVAFGIVLVALGWVLEASVGIGGAIRTLCGVFFLAGLALVSRAGT